MFMRNPYRRNPFDAFPLETQETSIKNIRRVINQARADWKDNKGRLLARDGTDWKLTEAQLNGLEETIVDPLRRLQAEQFVHREHVFTQDPVLGALAAELAADLGEDIASLRVLDDVGADLMRELAKSLPPPRPVPLADDQPWPEPPGPLAIELEPLSQTILRER